MRAFSYFRGWGGDFLEVLEWCHCPISRTHTATIRSFSQRVLDVNNPPHQYTHLAPVATTNTVEMIWQEAFVRGREWRNPTGPSWKNKPRGASGAFVHKCGVCVLRGGGPSDSRVLPNKFHIVNRPIRVLMCMCGLRQILLCVSLLQAQTADRSGQIVRWSRLPCFNSELVLV